MARRAAPLTAWPVARGATVALRGTARRVVLELEPRVARAVGVEVEVRDRPDIGARTAPLTPLVCARLRVGTARRGAAVEPAVLTPLAPRVALSSRGVADRRCAPGVSPLPALRLALGAMGVVLPEGTARRPVSVVGAVALLASRGIRVAGRRARSVPDTNAFEA